MRPGALVLVNGPLDHPALWAATAEALRAGGHPALAPEVEVHGAPYGIGWLAAAARPMHAAAPPDPLVLVGHGSAGPLLPALARTQRAAGRSVGGYVFVDAALPRPGRATPLDLLEAADPDLGAEAHEFLHTEGARWPSEAEMARDHAFWTEPLPPPLDWPDGPCAFVSTGAEVPGVGDTAFWARSARSRGWTVTRGAAGPVGAVDADPAGLAAVIVDVVDGLPG